MDIPVPQGGGRHADLQGFHLQGSSVSSLLSFSCFSPSFTSSLPHSTYTLRSIAPMAIYHPPTGYEPNVFDDFHFSKTSEMIFQEETGDIDTEPSFLCDVELDDETIGKALSSPLCEKNQRTGDKLITLMKKVCCQLSPFSHTQERGDPYTNFQESDKLLFVSAFQKSSIRFSSFTSRLV